MGYLGAKVKKMIRTKQEQGFSFIEILVYISVGSLVLLAVVSLGLNLMNTRARARTRQELNQNLRLAAERISFEIRNATAINSVADSSLSLNASESARSPLIIDLAGERIRIGSGTSGLCSSLAPCAITSNLIRVSDLTFINLSSGSAALNVQFEITMESSGGKAEYQYSQTYRGAAEIRSN